MVGSILPSDIDLNRVNSDGVKMLRSYIEFAMNDSVTQKVLKSTDNFELDEDRFCESVANYIEKQGYNISKKVGCSSYTVDIAIEKPGYPGFFAAGIECDGNTYILAKTARDRDRLRSSILKGMGWNLYRVWSTDWIRNPNGAKTALLAFIEEALKKPVNNSVFSEGRKTLSSKSNIEDIVEKVQQEIEAKTITPVSFELTEYNVTDWRDVQYPPNANIVQRLRH